MLTFPLVGISISKLNENVAFAHIDVCPEEEFSETHTQMGANNLT